MLRIKRSVQAQYNTDVNFIASQALARSQRQPGGEDDMEVTDAMAALERQSKAPQGFVAASTGPVGGKPVPTSFTSNPDAIDIDGPDE
jgi:pre-mRNA-splicing factor SYF1